MSSVSQPAAYRSLIHSLVDQDLPGPALLAAAAPALNALGPADDFLRFLRDEPAWAFICYEAPRGVCAKPTELALALLLALVAELVAEREVGPPNPRGETLRASKPGDG